MSRRKESQHQREFTWFGDFAVRLDSIRIHAASLINYM